MTDYQSVSQSAIGRHTHRVRVVLFVPIEQAPLLGRSELDAKDVEILFATHKFNCEADEEKLNEPHSCGLCEDFEGLRVR